MTPRRWAVLAALLSALVLVQAFGLDRQPETIEEDRYRNVAEMPASEMVPTYVASLFFGAFRAVVVDALWIQLKKVEEEKRWYEQREILKLISYFQPRNPEVWAHLGWHAAYNVANGFTDPEKSWEWVKFGLKWLRQGNTMLPDSSYLKYELARTLFYKPTWRDGVLDVPLLRRIEQDAELQEILRLDPPAGRPLSAFELAIPWLKRAADEISARPGRYVLTPTGLYLRPLSMDGLVRQCLYFQGIYLWQSRRWEEAADLFRRASAHTSAMVHKAYDEPMSTIFKDWVIFYERMAEIAELDRKATASGSEEDARALLGAMQAALLQFGPIDESFLTNVRKTGRVDELKRMASRGRDPAEFNDTFEVATELPEGHLAQANLEPRGLDVDFYRLSVPNPSKTPGPDDRPGKPVPVTVFVRRPEGATLDLKVTLFDASKRPVREAEMRGDLKVEYPADRYGTLYLKVEPLTLPDPWPANTSYTVRFQLGD